MKKFYSLLIMLMTSTLLLAQNAGIFESFVIVNDGVNYNNKYFNLQSANTFNSKFDGANLGTYGSNGNLTIGSYAKTWQKTALEKVTQVTFFYRVYKQGTTPPAFSSINITPSSFLGTDAGSDNYGWGPSTQSGNLISSSMTDGTYVVETFLNASSSIPSVYYDSNNSNNYKATFVYNASLSVADVSKTGKSVVAGGKLLTPKKGNLNLTVFDFSGKVVKTISAKGDGSAIDLNLNKSGLFLVKISDSVSTEVIKFSNR